MSTIREATYDLLRTLGLTTVFGNPGSMEETFLQHFPSDFTYVLGLQEASVVAMADGYAQGTGGPGLDLPGLDIVSQAKGFGVGARSVANPDQLRQVLQEALAADGPMVVEVPITKAVPPLL